MEAEDYLQVVQHVPEEEQFALHHRLQLGEFLGLVLQLLHYEVDGHLVVLEALRGYLKIGYQPGTMKSACLA